ncbi:MAG: hypothetical protein AB7Y46_09320 [Armatimonadota bacterium]
MAVKDVLPQPREVAVEMGTELLDGLAVHAGGSAIGGDALEGRAQAGETEALGQSGGWLAWCH